MEKLLTEGKEMAYISKQLVTLKTDCHFIDEIENYELPNENPILKIADTLLEFDLKRIVDRVNKDGLTYKTKLPKDEEKNEEFEYILLNDKNRLNEVIDSIAEDKNSSF